MYPDIFPIAQIACSEISEKREVRSLQKRGIAPLSYKKINLSWIQDYYPLKISKKKLQIQE